MFELPKDIDEGEVLDKAIDAGALDVEMERDEEGIDIVIISTEASEAAAVGEKLGELMGVKPRSQDLVWEAKEDTSVEVEEGSSVEDSVGKLVAKLEDDASVQGVYLNIA